jgi:uncharacterized protein
LLKSETLVEKAIAFMADVASLFIYPIKSLDGIAVTQAKILASGALQHDREYAIIDVDEKYVNGKRNIKVHGLRSHFDLASHSMTLQNQVFDLEQNRPEIEAWLGDYFGFPVKLAQNSLTGFPDDAIASGPTIISTATLEEVTSWFPGITVAEMRRRLRANIEIAGVPPFWEDQLFANQGEVVKFQIGEVLVEGINPCQRCIVPTRNTQTGEAYPNFQKIFTQKRKETLPDWVNKSRFNHFYRLSLNTKIPSSEAGKTLKIGDELRLGLKPYY